MKVNKMTKLKKALLTLTFGLGIGVSLSAYAYPSYETCYQNYLQCEAGSQWHCDALERINCEIWGF
jgi:hypothetical protein